MNGEKNEMGMPENGAKTIGEVAENLSVNEEMLDKYIKEYSIHEEGTVGHDIYERLLRYKHSDNLSRTIDMQLAGIEIYILTEFMRIVTEVSNINEMGGADE